MAKLCRPRGVPILASAPRTAPRKAWLRGAEPAAHDAKGQNLGSQTCTPLLKLFVEAAHEYRTVGRLGHQHTLTLDHHDHRRCTISYDTHDCDDDNTPCVGIVRRMDACASTCARACAHLYCYKLMSFHDMVRLIDLQYRSLSLMTCSTGLQ